MLRMATVYCWRWSGRSSRGLGDTREKSRCESLSNPYGNSYMDPGKITTSAHPGKIKRAGQRELHYQWLAILLAKAIAFFSKLKALTR